MSRLNDFQRGIIVSLHKIGMTTAQIVVRLRERHRVEVSDRTVRNVMAEYRKRGGRPKRERRGRKRKCSRAQERLVVREAERNRWLSIRALTERVNNVLRGEGVRVSSETVRKTLLKHGLRKRRAARKPLLTQVQRQRRLDFARRHAHWTAIQWQSVVFSDEKIFRAANNRTSSLVTRTPAQRFLPACIQNAPKHSVQVHAWGAIGWAGVGPLKRVEGNLNAARYQEQILADLGPTCNVLARRGHPWYFLQDNAPAHNAATTRAFLEARHIRLVDWPGNSPDLNPIEHLWSFVQRRLPRLLPRNVNEYWALVQRAWRTQPTWLVRRLITSMPRRLAAVIAAEGGPTRY